MSELHELNSAIETMREAVKQDLARLALAEITAAEAAEILRHLQECNRARRDLITLRDIATKRVGKAA